MFNFTKRSFSLSCVLFFNLIFLFSANKGYSNIFYSKNISAIGQLNNVNQHYRLTVKNEVLDHYVLFGQITIRFNVMAIDYDSMRSQKILHITDE
jgi:hypothetical protein